VGLRGGYDTNPTQAAAAVPSALFGLDAAIAAGRDTPDYRAGIALEASRTEYTASGKASSERYHLAIEGANRDQNDVTIRSTTRVTATRNYDTRDFDATQGVRVQWIGGALRPFATFQAGYASLNETNAIFPDFLPRDLRYLRATLIPGIAYTFGKAEIGASVNLSAARYLDTFDSFGFRRDNERVQPFLFFRYNDGINVIATLSRFNGDWHDPVFSDVNATLYELTLSKTFKAVEVAFNLRRSVGETTFPLSPITISDEIGGRFTVKIDDDTSVTASVRRVKTAYLDSPFVSRALVYGIAASRNLGNGFMLGAEIDRVQAEPLGGADVSGVVAFVSLTSRFGNADKKQAGLLPAAEVLSSSPRMLRVSTR
jgi:hypothetical protein